MEFSKVDFWIVVLIFMTVVFVQAILGIKKSRKSKNSQVVESFLVVSKKYLRK